VITWASSTRCSQSGHSNHSNPSKLTSSPTRSWKSIEELADAVRACDACVLHTTRTNAVPGAGSPKAEILIIGEGPGFNEDQQGLPFIGRSGKLLDELLAQVPLSRDDVFITNVVKCRPPENRDPLPAEVASCRPYLERQIELLDPKVVVTLGRHSMLRFYPKGKISEDHGKILEWEGRILFPLYHPAAGLRNPAIKRDLQEDILRLPAAVLHSKGEAIEIAADEIESDSSVEIKSATGSSSKLFEPLLTNETTTEEQGDGQLGLF
jgi:uracil-DNA glycosylase